MLHDRQQQLVQHRTDLRPAQSQLCQIGALDRQGGQRDTVSLADDVGAHLFHFPDDGQGAAGPSAFGGVIRVDEGQLILYVLRADPAEQFAQLDAVGSDGNAVMTYQLGALAYGTLIIAQPGEDGL